MVVWVGLTVAQSFALRLLPTPGVIEMAVAPVTCQHSLVELPASMVVGVATNTTICGTVPLATVIHTLHRAPKDVIKAQLCQEPDRLIYRLTLLGRDGKVKRATVDAINGAVVGER